MVYRAWIIISIVSVSANLALQNAATAATKVFLLAGQSNMAGVGGYPGGPGRPADQPCPLPYSTPQPAVRFWNNAWVDLRPGFGCTSEMFGPEVSFGYTLHNTIFPRDNIYLVKYGVSGTNLAVDWNPNGAGGCYSVFRSQVNDAIADLCGPGLSAEIAGMIWMQGEGDAVNAAYAAAYETNLKDLIDCVRTDFKTPNMRFVIGQILPYYDTTPPGGNATVRAAEMAIPGQPGYENVACFKTDSLELAYAGHYGTKGQIDLGILFADQFAQTPEPSALVLAGTALLVLGWRVGRRRMSGLSNFRPRRTRDHVGDA
jgi:hypothetical protein